MEEKLERDALLQRVSSHFWINIVRHDAYTYVQRNVSLPLPNATSRVRSIGWLCLCLSCKVVVLYFTEVSTYVRTYSMDIRT